MRWPAIDGINYLRLNGICQRDAEATSFPPRSGRLAAGLRRPSCRANGDSRHRHGPPAEYVEPIEPTSPPPTAPPSGIADFTKALFPVKTPELTPGPVTSSALSLPHLLYPVFLVGTDALSRDWLFRYRDRLRELNAVGLLVEAASEADYEAMAQLAAGVRLVPVSGSDLAARLKLSHYPVLISKIGIEQ